MFVQESRLIANFGESIVILINIRCFYVISRPVTNVVSENSPDRETIVSVAESPPSEAVLQAIADAEGTDVIELPPLYEAVDPEALDAVFDGRAFGSIAFDYHGYSVTVNQNAVVSIRK